MKRTAALRELSDDHHTALVLARECVRTGEDGAAGKAVRDAWSRVAEAFAGHLGPHFEIEERHLLPGLREIGESRLADRIADDHAELRRLAEEGAPESERERLARFGRLLRDHVRFEEREVFETTQHRLPEASLRAIARACEALPRACPASLRRASAEDVAPAAAPFRVRPLAAEEAEVFVALRRRGLEEAPLAFGASPEDDFASDVRDVREQLRAAPDRVILGAFDGASGAEALVGAVGVFRERHRKAAHKVRMWGLYVEPASRERGIGAALVAAAVEHARSLAGVARVHLSVSSEAPAARRLYEKAGFSEWGEEPDALRHQGRSAVEHHLALDLSGREP